MRTKLTRLFSKALRFKRRRLISPHGFETRTNTKLLRSQSCLEVLLAGPCLCLLVSQRSTKCLIGVHPRHLVLRRQVLDVGLAGSVKVSQRRLQAHLSTKLLSAHGSLQVSLPASEVSLLVSQRSAHSLFSVKPLRLELCRHILHIGLLSSGQVSQCRLKIRLSTKLLHTKSRLQVSLLRRHLSSPVTLKLPLRTLKRRLQPTGFDVTHLLAKSALTFRGSQELTSAAIGALPSSSKVLSKLRLARIVDRFALLNIQHVADVRRHILLGLRLTKTLRPRHLEAFKVGLELRLRSIHLRRVILSSLNIAGAIHLELLQLWVELRLRRVHLGSLILTRRNHTGLLRPILLESGHPNLLCGEL